MKYKEGGKDYSGLKIKELVQLSPKGAIYLTSHGLYWDVADNLGTHWDRSKAQAINLLAPVRLTITDVNDRHRAQTMVAGGLAEAMNATPLNADHDFLREAAEFITTRQREILQVRYFVAAVITTLFTTLLFLSILFLTKGSQTPGNAVSTGREFLAALLLGGVGAMISVSQRFRSIEVERYMSRYLAVIGGSSRIVFGSSFGAVFLLLQKAGIILSAANDKPWFLAAVALVAGFSERAIPEVLAQFETQIALRKNKSKKRGKTRDQPNS